MIKNKKNGNPIRRRNVNSTGKDTSTEESRVGDITKGVSILNNYQAVKQKERTQRIKKVKNEVETARLHKMNVNVKPIVLTFVIIFIVFGLFMVYWYGPIFGISFHKDQGINEKQRIDIVSTDQDIYKMYNEQLLVYSNQIVRAYNSNADEVFEYTLPEAFVPEIYTKGRFMVILNKAKGIVYLFENNNEILNKQIEGDIKSVYIDGNGNFAVEYSASGYKRIICLYDKNGNEMITTHVGGSGISDLEILESGNKILIVEVDTESLTAGISIKTINVTGQSDNLKEIAKIDNSLLQNLTIQGQDIIMLLDSKIVKCNIDTGKLTEIKNFNDTQVSHIALSNSYYSLVGDTQIQNDNGMHSYKFETTMFDTKSIYSGTIINMPKAIKNTGLLTYLVYQDRLQIINKWGMLIKDIPVDYSLKDVIVFGNERCFALVYTNKIYIVNV